MFPDKGAWFAMHCGDVATHIDLNERPNGVIGRLRFFLHLSLCRACTNYESVSHALSSAVKSYLKASSPVADVEKINQSLLEKHSKKNL